MSARVSPKPNHFDDLTLPAAEAFAIRAKWLINRKALLATFGICWMCEARCVDWCGDLCSECQAKKEQADASSQVAPQKEKD